MSTPAPPTLPAAPATPVAPAGASAALPAPAKAPRNGFSRRLLFIPVVLLALVGIAIGGYRYWYEDQNYVTTENAQVAGAMVQFGSLNAGRVVQVHVDVGMPVVANQDVAVVTVPSTVLTSTSGVTRIGFTGTDEDRVVVRAPFNGVVVARLSNPGDTVQAGQAMLAVVDPQRLWVQAQIEETKIRRVRVGQRVDVTLDQLSRTLPGRVQAITPASAGTFAVLPAQNTTGNFNKVTQLVPVKIAFDYGDELLMLGTSVTVRIHVGEE